VGLGQVICADEIQIISRVMILRKCAEHAALKKPNRQVEARGAVLALVITIGRKVDNVRRHARVAKNVRYCPIDISIPPPPLLVGRPSTIAYRGDNQPVFDTTNLVLIACKPSYCADCSRCE